MPVLPISELIVPKSPTPRKGSVQGSLEDLSNTTIADRLSRKSRKKRQDGKPAELEKKSASPQRNEWTLAGTSLFQYPEDLGLKDISEISQLDEFIHKKVKLNSDTEQANTSVIVVCVMSVLCELNLKINMEINIFQISQIAIMMN